MRDSYVHGQNSFDKNVPVKIQKYRRTSLMNQGDIYNQRMVEHEAI